MILSECGLRRTKPRVEVLNILSHADSLISAEDIYEKCEGISLSTVYRIMEKLCENHVALKKHVSNSDKAYYEIVSHTHGHYAVCLGCGKKHYIDTCPVDSSGIDGFTVTEHKLELYGYCDGCGND